MAKIDVTELDIFLITYDEPNAEENWADLMNKVPWAKRIHGVKGFDAAHKAAAEQSETERFITVDGDNRVLSEFFDQVLDVPDQDHQGNDLSESIFSWNAKNLLNGLVYGNGGLKCWPTEYTKTIATHEAATDGEGMEFCWKLNYIQLNNIFSEIHQTATPYQAFRSGFREGVKMSLNQGKRVKPDEFKEKIWYGNYNRLQTWCNIGADVENGWWAMYGARLGCHKAVLTDWDPNLIADYTWFRKYFQEQVAPEFDQFNDCKCPVSKLEWDGQALWDRTVRLGWQLNEEINSMMLFEPSPTSSQFFKKTYTNPPRLGAMVREKQIQDLLEKGLI